MRRLIVKNRGVVSIAVVIGILIGVAVLGFGGNKILKFSQASSLVRQADELKINEKYEEAIKLLEKAQDKAFTQNLKERISKGLEENKQLIMNRDIYYQGVEKAKNNDWQGAMDLWTKIPEDSICSKMVKYEEKTPFTKPLAGYVSLINYSYAKDPTLEELIAFLKKDDTDDHLYRIDSFVCSNFAELLHNNAEKAGIKAAFVVIEFSNTSTPHALNAFNTIDKRLVYVDDTGKGFLETRKEHLSQECEWDKIAYIVENKEYGQISIDFPSISPEYQFYENHIQKWRNFLTKVKSYNEKITRYEEKRENYEKRLKDWEEREKIYEEKVEDYNRRVEIYNKEGRGDYNKFKIEEEGLNKERENLIIEQNTLITEYKLSEEEFKSFNREKELLDNEEKKFKTCIWESLGIIKNIEVYW